MKLWQKISIIAAVVIVIGLIIYPHIVIDTGEALIVCNYDGNFIEYEQNQTLNENYCYNEKYDVSLYTFDVNNFLFFHTVTMKYVEGDMREVEFILEEDYIKNFLENAEITENPNNIDLAALIEGREAIVSNTRYVGNDYENAIYYILDGRYDELYIFYEDDLLIIQVGNPDDGSRFIAYR